LNINNCFFSENYYSTNEKYHLFYINLKNVTKPKLLAKKVAKLNDVVLYIWKSTFFTSFMDVLNNILDHSKLSTLRLWLPVSLLSFSHFFVLTHRRFLLFIHSYCHHFGGSFMVELAFYFGYYWEKKAHTNNNKPTT
jgi:hypothetical protein